MHLRTPLIAGNWKMNLDRRSAMDLMAAVRQCADATPGVDVAVYPPSLYVDEVVRAASGSNLVVGAQDCCEATEGAFTGEISSAMLRDVGATSVLVGHSERRHVYGEDDARVRAKLERGLEAGLGVVLCIGEQLDEREDGRTEAVCAAQMQAGLAGLDRSHLSRITLAYEPVWAIGTGKVATPEQAGEVHGYLRGLVTGLFDERAAGDMRILYGGSVKKSNAAELLSVPDIDGALVGGASLTSEGFLPIIEAAAATATA
ncbi:MAG: triosephosphate isomerase [Planctomycetota bacterium]|jgi:triosephosphate isomerase